MSDKMQQILEDARRLEALVRTELVDSPTEEAFDRLTQLASTILNAPISMVSLVEPHRQFLKSQVGLPERVASQRETPISHSFCKHVVATGEPLIVQDSREHPIVKDNPSVVDYNVISYLGIPLKSPDGESLGSFCVIDHEPRAWTEKDIETMTALAESVMTEINLRLEAKAKERALADLQARNEELDAFAYTVSHNLKNPISGIIGWVSLSTEYGDRMSVKELMETIENVGDLAQYSNSIINALLLLAGFSQADHIEITELNMFNIIDDALSRLSMELEANNVTVHLPASDTFPRSVGYRLWVEEVWVNYITNAIKYGGNPPVIEFGAHEEPDNMVRYWIRDNGNGLSVDEQKKLFVPFSRLPRSANNVEGHGLGLSIVERIVEKLGGTVGVESAVGEGSTFGFTLPAAQSD